MREPRPKELAEGVFCTLQKALLESRKAAQMGGFSFAPGLTEKIY